MSPADRIRLFIIVPVYGNWEDALECLRALSVQSTANFHVLIADDGSPSPPPAEIHAFPFASYLRDANRGFAGNCNRAALMAMEKGATHMLFLNSDTIFGSSFVDQWLCTAQELPDALLSPMVYWFTRPSQVWFSGGKQNIWVPFKRLHREFRKNTLVDIVCGCALLAPANRWKELGGFDERYITYYEDFDLTLRAKNLGIQTYVVSSPELRVLHKVSGSFRGETVWPQHYRLLSSSLMFIRRHYRGLQKWLCLTLKGVHLVAVVALNLPDIPSPRLLWKATAAGLFDRNVTSARSEAGGRASGSLRCAPVERDGEKPCRSVRHGGGG